MILWLDFSVLSMKSMLTALRNGDCPQAALDLAEQASAYGNALSYMQLMRQVGCEWMIYPCRY